MAKRFSLSAGNFKGLDERAGSSTSIQSLPKLVNMRVNESGALEKRCGYSVLATIKEGEAITALWQGEIDGQGCILASCDKGIYSSVDSGNSFSLLANTNEPVFSFIPFGGKVYCLGGGLYRCSYNLAVEVDGYVPTVAISCSSSGDGTMLESPNMLITKRRILYNGDGSNLSYILPEKNVDTIESVHIDGILLDSGSYTFYKSNALIEFVTAPNEGINNVEIYYSVEDNSLRSVISNCKYGVVFESRLFLYGNPEYPDRVFRSDLADGIPSCEYFSELGYHAFEKKVTSLIPCYNRLLLFFDDSACFTYAELKTDSLGSIYTSFPVYELHSSKGNIALGTGCSVENTPITICRDGLNRWVSTAIADERSSKAFSARAFKFMAKIENSLDSVVLFNRKATSEMWLCSNAGILIYNYALDCFYIYDLNTVGALYEMGNSLLLGMKNGSVCLFDSEYCKDGDAPIKTEFETPYCSFGSPYSLKSLQGVSVSFAGGKSLEAEIAFSKGNLCDAITELVKIQLPSIGTDAFRKVQNRVIIKRFYSVKLSFCSCSDNVSVTDLHLFVKQHSGGIRIN